VGTDIERENLYVQLICTAK